MPRRLATTSGEELDPHAGAPQRRLARAHLAHHPPRRRQAHHVHLVGVGLELDVVAEPACLLMGIGRAAHAGQQPDVVDDRALRGVEAQPPPEPERDPRGAKHVLHRLAKADVDGKGQRGDELRTADFVATSVPSHGPSLCPVRRGGGGCVTVSSYGASVFAVDANAEERHAKALFSVVSWNSSGGEAPLLPTSAGITTRDCFRRDGMGASGARWPLADRACRGSLACRQVRRAIDPSACRGPARISRRRGWMCYLRARASTQKPEVGEVAAAARALLLQQR